MFKRFVLICLLLLLALPASAGRELLNGGWLSESGAFIMVGPTRPDNTFVMNVYKNAQSNELSAQVTGRWIDSTTQFVYTMGGTTVKGMFWERSDTVDVKSGNWSATWRRN